MKNNLLAQLKSDLEGCTACALHKERKQPVLGRGNPDAPVVFVGEAPGATEDELGIPFCGRSGQLLDKMIAEAGFDLSTDVYILNINKCRPPNNRKPETSEMAACKPFLNRQLEIISPKVLVALGATAIVGLCGAGVGITKRRGAWEAYNNIPVMPTYHPAYCLRNPPSKKDVMIDLEEVRKKLTSIESNANE